MFVQPLLSICIPTYNRANILELTLKNICEDKDFDPELIEVVVLDNCSTDNTNEIVNKFYFVKYFKNTSTIPAGINVIKSLEYGNGKYLKLYNDTVIIKSGTISFIIEKIKKNALNENLLFYNNNHLYSNCEIKINDKNSLIETVSFSNTWILNFGIFRADLNKITNKFEFSELLLPQVDILFKLFNKNKNFTIYFSDFVDVNHVEKKGGYNLFDVFINNYLFILKLQKFSFKTYEIEKYRLFRYFIFPWLTRLFIVEKSSYTFETKKSISILIKKYYYHIYIYPFLFLFLFKLSFHSLTENVRKIIY
jgi:glycosyltransferase involved in cell wall biosynthesis